MLIQGVPGFTQKGLEVSQNDPAGPRGSSGGFRGSCCLLEESGDVLELSWGPQEGLESSRRVWRCPRGVSLRSEGPQGFRESSRGLQWGF